MCGFLLSFSQSARFLENEFQQALELQAHRGPDNQGIEVRKSGKLMIGHNRLSIIDLSAAAVQPFHSMCGAYTLLFNGEIYNYRDLRANLKQLGLSFQSDSDTEVLLAGLVTEGASFIDKIEGMFAFALINNKEDYVLFGRDEGGEKPLYYKILKDGIILASNLFSISKLGNDNELSELALCEYLVNGYPSKDRTLLDGVLNCEPGEIKQVDLATLTVKTAHIQKIPMSPPTNLELALSEAVNATLTSDVPVCVSLSGGLDSSLIVGLASKLGINISTFSIVFGKDKSFDESKLSRKISSHFGSNHKEILVQDFSDDDILAALDCIDSPIIDSSIVPTFLLYQEIAKHYRVVLGGDGADELFAGYKHLKRYNFVKQLHSPTVLWMLSQLSNNTKHQTKLANWQSLLVNPCTNIRRFTGSDCELPNRLRQYFFQSENDWSVNSENQSSITTIIENDYQNYLKKSILVKSDRCSMGNSVEARSPFLSQRLRAYRNTLRNGRDYDLLRGKKELIRVAKKYFPVDYPFGYKRGFNFPLKRYLQDNRLNVIWDLMYQNNLNFEHNFLDRVYQMVVKEDVNGAENLVFGLALANNWLEKIMETK